MVVLENSDEIFYCEVGVISVVEKEKLIYESLEIDFEMEGEVGVGGWFFFLEVRDIWFF